MVPHKLVATRSGCHGTRVASWGRLEMGDESAPTGSLWGQFVLTPVLTLPFVVLQ